MLDGNRNPSSGHGSLETTLKVFPTEKTGKIAVGIWQTSCIPFKISRRNKPLKGRLHKANNLIWSDTPSLHSAPVNTAGAVM